MKEKNVKNRWLTPLNLEEEYQIKRSTQARLRMGVKIPFSKIGTKIVRYDREKIDAWLEDAEVVS